VEKRGSLARERDGGVPVHKARPVPGDSRRFRWLEKSEVHRSSVARPLDESCRRGAGAFREASRAGNVWRCQRAEVEFPRMTETARVGQFSTAEPWQGNAFAIAKPKAVRPGNGVSTETITLWRPVGPAELDLIRASGMTAFPPRLPDQPIFYPVTTEDYAFKSRAGFTSAMSERCLALRGAG
jgi:hypothetical protein